MSEPKQLPPIIIGPYVYNVGIGPNLTHGDDDSQQGIWGLCDKMHQRILLEESMTPTRQLVAQWHEVLHAIANDFAIPLEEQSVATLATVIVQLLRDNEELRGNHIDFSRPMGLKEEFANGYGGAGNHYRFGDHPAADTGTVHDSHPGGDGTERGSDNPSTDGGRVSS